MATHSLSPFSQPFPTTSSRRNPHHPRKSSSQLLKPITTFTKRNQFIITEATKEEDRPLSESVTTESESSSAENPPEKDELTELEAEIKKAIKEKEEKDFWGGVGAIAGSSVALLTVNAVSAELSDKIFAGRGVQDFFG